MRKRGWFVGGLGGLAAFGYLVLRPAASEAEVARFVSGQSARLRACRTLGDARRVAPFARAFPDGRWVAAVNEFACSSGAGFDATVFYDSDGVVRVDRTHHFCGYEGLTSELEHVEAASLTDFYRGLPQCRLVRVP